MKFCLPLHCVWMRGLFVPLISLGESFLLVHEYSGKWCTRQATRVVIVLLVAMLLVPVHIVGDMRFVVAVCHDVGGRIGCLWWSWIVWNAVGFKIAIEMELIAKHFNNVNARGDYTQMAFWAGGCLCLWGRILLQNLINGFYRLYCSKWLCWSNKWHCKLNLFAAGAERTNRSNGTAIVTRLSVKGLFVGQNVV